MPGWLKALVWLVVVIGALGAGAYYLFIDVWRVPVDDPLISAAIVPTLGAGDVVAILRSHRVERGALVRCADPQAPGRFVIARAIASSGELIEIRDEVVSVDRHRNPSPRACEPPQWTVLDPKNNEQVELQCGVEDYAGRDFQALRSAAYPEPATTKTVDPERWFLVSDNRHIHLDSRDFGTIDPSTCQRVILRIVGPAGIGDADRRFTFIW